MCEIHNGEIIRGDECNASTARTTLMDQVCFVLPIVPGKTDQARRFIQEMGGARRDDFDRAQRRCGIVFEAWYLSSLPTGDSLVVFQHSDDIARAFSIIAQSEDAFDRWFIHGLIEVTGVDLDNLPEMQFPEVLLIHSTQS
jgi:hypothetical protein